MEKIAIEILRLAQELDMEGYVAEADSLTGIVEGLRDRGGVRAIPDFSDIRYSKFIVFLKNQRERMQNLRERWQSRRKLYDSAPRSKKMYYSERLMSTWVDEWDRIGEALRGVLEEFHSIKPELSSEGAAAAQSYSALIWKDWQEGIDKGYEYPEESEWEGFGEWT